MISQIEVQNYLPLTEATFFIMLSLSYEPKHGYAIMKEVQELSEGRINLSTGTLYGVLKRLLDQDWIERLEMDEISPSPSSINPRLRKAYTLSHTGKRILDAEADRLQKLVTAVKLRTEGKQA